MKRGKSSRQHSLDDWPVTKTTIKSTMINGCEILMGKMMTLAQSVMSMAPKLMVSDRCDEDRQTHWQARHVKGCWKVAGACTPRKLSTACAQQTMMHRKQVQRFHENKNTGECVDKHYDVKDFLDANKESSVVIRKRECSVKCGSLLHDGNRSLPFYSKHLEVITRWLLIRWFEEVSQLNVPTNTLHREHFSLQTTQKNRKVCLFIMSDYSMKVEQTRKAT